MPSLDRATGWLNSPPLTAADLRGHVVLVNFWTYTCINWLRTLPYLRACADKYQDQGLVVIGVHTPEFDVDPRLYQLVRQPGPVSERAFEVTFLDPGIQAYAFTFG
jgi:thiol-disulfide isomerase/thioredoxin